MIPQAGAIALRRVAGSPRVLLVRARKDPTQWIFPKGHIEPGETAEDAALRELREESGVRGRLLGSVGNSEFVSGSEFVRVQYFAVKATGQKRRLQEGRERCWATVEQANGLLSFNDAKKLLAKAVTLL